MSNWVYLAGDVDAIKDFVLETSSLPQVRGGSELLLECEEEIQKLQKEYGYEVVYCGGGTFLLHVPSDRANQVREAIEALYLQRTLVATVTIVHEGQLPPADSTTRRDDLNGWAGRLLRATPPTGDGFAWRMARLQARLREAKDERRHVPFYQALPFGQRCTRCGKRMAAQERERLDERLCPVCYLRDETGRSRIKNIHGRKVRGRFDQEFWSEHGQNITAEQPDDLDQLVAEAPRKYLAFLYADGNDIGRLLHGVEGQEHYEALSEALREGTKAAVYRAIKEVCLPVPPRLPWWPFHILNVGGDDVMVLIQAGYAWEVAVRFLQLFEEEVTRRAREALEREGRDWPGHWPQRIGASCAVVVADAKYPIRYMEHLASDLLSKAKRLAKEKSTSAVTFLWLPTPVASESAEPLLATFAYEMTPGDRAELFSRPYTLSQARQLQECIGRIDRWPRSLRHRWQEALRQGVVVSTALIAYDIGRQRGQRAEMAEVIELLDRIWADTGEGQQRLSPPVWRRLPPAAPGDKVVWKTALFDALQLAELQAMRPDWREEAVG